MFHFETQKYRTSIPKLAVVISFLSSSVFAGELSPFMTKTADGFQALNLDHIAHLHWVVKLRDKELKDQSYIPPRLESAQDEKGVAHQFIRHGIRQWSRHHASSQIQTTTKAIETGIESSVSESWKMDTKLAEGRIELKYKHHTNDLSALFYIDAFDSEFGGRITHELNRVSAIRLEHRQRSGETLNFIAFNYSF